MIKMCFIQLTLRSLICGIPNLMIVSQRSCVNFLTSWNRFPWYEITDTYQYFVKDFKLIFVNAFKIAFLLKNR